MLVSTHTDTHLLTHGTTQLELGLDAILKVGEREKGKLTQPGVG